MKRILFVAGLKPDKWLSHRIEPGAVSVVDDTTADRLMALHKSIIDITPGYIAGAFGDFRPPVHARFWTDVCPCRTSGRPRFTTCRMCGDTGRLVIT